MIHVIAIITVKPGKRAEVLLAFNEIVATVLQEEGCIEYGPTIDTANAPSIQTPVGSNTFVVVEKWSSVDTLDAHGKSDHMVAYGAKVKHLIDDRVIHILEPAGLESAS